MLAGAALFDVNEVSDGLMRHYRGGTAVLDGLRTAEQTAALARVEEWPDVETLCATVIAFIEERLVAMNLSSLDGLVFLAGESHSSKTGMEVLAAVIDYFHGRAAEAWQPLQVSLLWEAEAGAMPVLETRAHELRRMLDATPAEPLYAGGLHALETATSLDELHLQHSLTCGKLGEAQRRGMPIAGFDSDRFRFWPGSGDARDAPIEQPMAHNIWGHVQRARGILIVSLGAAHVKGVLEALSGLTPVIGSSPVGDVSLDADAFTLACSGLLAYRPSQALESAWLNTMRWMGTDPPAPTSTPPDPQTVVHESGRLRATMDSTERSRLLSRVQTALAHSTLSGMARASVFRELTKTLGDQGRSTLAEFQLAWVRRLCDAMLHETPPTTAAERTDIATQLASGIRGYPPEHYEARCTNAWAVARVDSLSRQGFDTGRQSVFLALINTLARRPSFLLGERSKSQLLHLIDRVIPRRSDAVTRHVAAAVRGDPSLADYLGDELHARLQFTLSRIPLFSLQ